MKQTNWQAEALVLSPAKHSNGAWTMPAFVVVYQQHESAAMGRQFIATSRTQTPQVTPLKPIPFNARMLITKRNWLAAWNWPLNSLWAGCRFAFRVIWSRFGTEIIEGLRSLQSRRSCCRNYDRQEVGPRWPPRLRSCVGGCGGSNDQQLQHTMYRILFQSGPD